MQFGDDVLPLKHVSMVVTIPRIKEGGAVFLAFRLTRTLGSTIISQARNRCETPPLLTLNSVVKLISLAPFDQPITYLLHP